MQRRSAGRRAEAPGNRRHRRRIRPRADGVSAHADQGSEVGEQSSERTFKQVVESAGRIEGSSRAGIEVEVRFLRSAAARNWSRAVGVERCPLKLLIAGLIVAVAVATGFWVKQHTPPQGKPPTVLVIMLMT